MLDFERSDCRRNEIRETCTGTIGFARSKKKLPDCSRDVLKRLEER